ncbi:MAG: formaldehyde-activating enzyme [Parvibaculum sp.]|uniref:formaldehyde-activating enzyme n=1 Tax=Parvibaculum sp. TaxID=2024848 RepID=UPI00283E9DD5|nr:formaldehyde-activating enzyme [Parvibaculum sp.]MDR3499941.1 formaldehyde-activating enzyme [Parvibaculum sp.]
MRAMMIGESYVGEGIDAAHLNLMLGPRDGPVGQAFANALAAPRMGYIPFMAVVRPNVPATPATLFVSKGDLRGPKHENLVWGPAQLGVARGITEALVEGDLPPEAEHGWVAIAAVWVSWDASDADAVYRNNHQATRLAVRRALSTESERETLARYASRPLNSYYQPKD